MVTLVRQLLHPQTVILFLLFIISGRFGNQADHFLGSLAFSKGLNRTLILPPWVEYRYGETKSQQVPFDKYFKVETLKLYHDVITMETFMNEIAPDIWPNEKRISFCYTQRSGSETNSCNAKFGNPFGPFWDTFNISFIKSEFYSPLNYDIHNSAMTQKWKNKYPQSIWPVLAFTGNHRNKINKYLSTLINYLYKRYDYTFLSL